MKTAHTDLLVMVTPHAKRSHILGWQDNVLKVKIQGVPEKGRVNNALIDFLADALGIPKSQITLTHGMTSRKKTLRIYAMTSEQIHRQLEEKK